MSIKHCILSAILLSMALSANALSSDTRLLQPSPSENWKTLSTAHFNIHFVDADKAYAQKMAAIAEKVHTQLQPFYPFTAIEKTEVVINDSVDFSNGAATPIPYNQFYIYMHAPYAGDLLSHNDWSELVFRHEYTHILHTNQVTGLPAKLRKVLGKAQGSLFPLFIFPQAWAPSWTAEGFAIHQESLLGYGRTGSAVSDAKMRLEVLKGGISLTAISYEGYYGSRWPYGQNYTYGSYFFEFLQQKYGEESLNNYINNYSDNLIPWRIHSRAREATGVDSKELWGQYQGYLGNKFQPQIEQIRDAGDMPGTIITDEPVFNHYLTPGLNGTIYYYHSDGINPPEIRQLHSDGKQTTITQLKSVSLLNWHPQSGLLVGRAGICTNKKLFKDLYLIKPGTTESVRLTNCARILHADWANDGKSIYAVQNNAGLYKLINFTLDGKITTLARMKQGEVLAGLSVSPDGQSLAVSVKRSGDGWNLEKLDLQDTSWSKLTQNNDLETQPVYSPSGKSILFLSDHNKRQELRELNLEDMSITTLTNSVGYIIEGLPHDDGTIWVTEYTGHGEIIRHIPKQAAYIALGETWPAINDKTIKIDTLSAKSDFHPEAYNNITSYNPIDTLKPTGWTPLLIFGDNLDSLFGVQISGRDILGFHEWSLTPSIFINDKDTVFGGIVEYSYDGRFSIFASRELDSSWSNGSVSSYEIENNFQLLAHKPVNHLDWSLNLSAGIGYERIKYTHVPTTSTRKISDTIVGAIINFNSLDRWHYSITPTDGYTASLTIESYDLSGNNSTHEGNAFILSAGSYFNPGKNNTLIIKADTGIGGDNIAPFQLGDHSDFLSSLGGKTKLGKRDFALRGYNNDPRLDGTRLFRLITEWHTPIASIYDGFNVPPLGIGKIHAAAFIDTGSAWISGRNKEFYTGIGAEITADILLGYDSLNIPLTLGIAYGLDNDIGEQQVYLQAGITF